MTPQYVVILLHGTSQAVRGEHLLDRAGIAAKLIPVPRKFASDCGVCLRVAMEDRERALEALRAAKLEPEAVHEV